MTARSIVLGGCLSLLLGLSGCGTTGADQKFLAFAATRMEGAAGPLPNATAAARKEFLAQVIAEMDGCENNAEALGLATAKARRFQLGVATVGILAGSIIVPALAAKATVARSTIAAWGGVAGAANAAQATLTASGYSPKQTVAAQRTYVSNINKVLDGLKDVQTGPDEAIFLLKLRFTCRIALPITDAEDSPLLDD